MNAREAIANLRELARFSVVVKHGPQVLFHYLADHVCDARLVGGQRLIDATDFAAWLRELADASIAKITAESGRVLIMRDRTLDKTCPWCSHIHQGEAECGEEMGGGRICRCELSVPA